MILKWVFREKFKTKVTRNLVLCLFIVIQIFLDKTGIINIYSAKSTQAFQGIQLFIADSRASKLLIFFNLSAKMHQILESRNEILSVSWYSELTAGIVIANYVTECANVHFFCLNNSVIIGGDRLLIPLYISIEKDWRFLLSIETEPSFSNSAPNDNVLSEWIMYKQCSYSLFTIWLYLIHFVNPFVPNAPFFYPLKTSENRMIF